MHFISPLEMSTRKTGPKGKKGRCPCRERKQLMKLDNFRPAATTTNYGVQTYIMYGTSYLTNEPVANSTFRSLQLSTTNKFQWTFTITTTTPAGIVISYTTTAGGVTSQPFYLIGDNTGLWVWDSTKPAPMVSGQTESLFTTIIPGSNGSNVTMSFSQPDDNLYYIQVNNGTAATTTVQQGSATTLTLATP